MLNKKIHITKKRTQKNIYKIEKKFFILKIQTIVRREYPIFNYKNKPKGEKHQSTTGTHGTTT